MKRRRSHARGRPTCRKALRELLEYAKGNRESREGNPYMKPSVQAAIIALGEDKEWIEMHERYKR